MIEFYLIFAFSFAIMYTYSYGIQTVRTILDTLNEQKIEYKGSDWGPKRHLLAQFLMAFIAAPLILIAMFTETKWEAVTRIARTVLQKYFGLKK